MSVPLDRLYHYLDDCVNHDLLIYRWLPHGSRKLEDLAPLIQYTEHQNTSWPTVIFHDQEPLNYKFYTREQIKDRTKFLLLHKYSAEIADTMSTYFADQHLRGVTYCANQYDLTILVHSEQRSQEVVSFAQQNFIPVYFWSHGLIALDWFRYAEHDPNLKFDTCLMQKDFLIYNRAWSGTREYRLAFAEQLVDNNLVNHCKTSFNPIDQQTHYTKHQFVNEDFVVSNHQLENYFSLNTYPATASADYVSLDYANTAIEVVLETLFDDSRLHLTEKTLRPIACGKPFMLAATAGSLQYLRDYGFETFAGLIDESYDTVENSQDRLNAIIQEMKRIAALDADAKQVLYAKLHMIAQRNKQHFFNKLFDQVTEEYRTNINQAALAMQQHCTGHHRVAIRQLLQQN
jgi:hypothetical protein